MRRVTVLRGVFGKLAVKRFQNATCHNGRRFHESFGFYVAGTNHLCAEVYRSVWPENFDEFGDPYPHQWKGIQSRINLINFAD